MQAASPTLGVMIARGDLAVEIGFERLAEMQEEILWLCEAAHVPVIWATQVLESLVKKGLPSRGEMTDAAMAGRAECVMLNKGPYVADAVSVARPAADRMGGNQTKKTPKLRALRKAGKRLPPLFRNRSDLSSVMSIDSSGRRILAMTNRECGVRMRGHGQGSSCAQGGLRLHQKSELAHTMTGA